MPLLTTPLFNTKILLIQKVNYESKKQIIGPLRVLLYQQMFLT